MKPILLLLAICYLPFANYGQGIPGIGLNDTKYWAIKWNHIGGLLHPYAPMFVFGIERRINNYGMCLQYGVAIPQSYTRDKIISGHTSGFTIRLDAKKYIQSKKPRKAAFDHILGIETFYTQYSHSDDMRYTDTLNRDNVYMDTVLYNRKMFGIALIAGVQHRVTKHILVQLYTGLGIKVRNITTEGSFTPPAGYKPGRGNMLGANPYEPGAHAALAMPFHFSIGYYFK